MGLSPSKAVLRKASDDTGVADLIGRVITLERVEIDDAPKRFFEVEMRGIIRLRNDRLMNSSAVSDYLSQVAPVPFSHGIHVRGEDNAGSVATRRPG